MEVNIITGGRCGVPARGRPHRGRESGSRVTETDRPTPKDPAALPAEAEGFRLEDHVFFYISQILARRNRRLNQDLKPFGLDFARWRVLAVVNEHPGCSMQHLADIAAVDRTTLTHTLRLMQAEGLIRREARPSDRRSVALSLTERGAASLAGNLPTVLRQTDLALAGLSGPERRALRQLLARVSDNLRDDPAE